ncbi:DUF7537 family lipoprotein [Haloprofundus halobius]|uniref:DUF7537 family lipoprotein n=1 Tax=Haloprofundus halobius TaxID=2876194 RepID=UPI001CCC4CE0|nr:hypothetical protein [Haloprofundus halobius]
MPSKIASLAVVTLVLLSGCGGLFDESTPTPTEERSNDARWLAPGLTGDGVEDASDLLGVHRETLVSQSRTTTRTQTFAAENGSEIANETVVVRATPNDGPRLVEADANGPARQRMTHWNERSVFWYGANESEFATLGEFSGHDEPHYTYRTETPDRFSISDETYSDRLSSLFTLMNVTVAPETVDNSVHRLEGSTPHLRLGEERLSNVTFTARVDYSGVVRSYELQYETERDGMTVRIAERVRITDIGTTDVERPAWVETAERERNETTQ